MSQTIHIELPEETKKAINDIKQELADIKEKFQPKEPKSLMTRQEVADFFSVDRSTIHNWCKNGKLNPLGKGARVYFDREEVENSLISLNK